MSYAIFENTHNCTVNPMYNVLVVLMKTFVHNLSMPPKLMC